MQSKGSGWRQREGLRAVWAGRAVLLVLCLAVPRCAHRPSDTASVPPPLSQTCGKVTSIGAGGAHTCVSCETGRVLCWGENGKGQLGDGSTQSRAVPQFVPGLENVTRVASGSAHTCALAKDGGVHCWGLGVKGPKAVLGLVLKTLAAGGPQTCGISQDGVVRCWEGVEGEPQAVAGLERVVSLAVGGAHGCAALESGAVLCWGDNARGQRGPGGAESRESPEGIPDIRDAVQVAAGLEHSCALRRTGQVLCWGYNARGQLGRETVERSGPAAPVPALTDATALSAAGERTCVARHEGGLLCWGEGERGPRAETLSAFRPYSVPGLAGVSALDVGETHVCAVADGGLFCSGQNGRGQLGAGASVMHSGPAPIQGLGEWPKDAPKPFVPARAVTAPTPVPFPAPATAVQTGDCQTCARDAKGRLSCADTSVYASGAAVLRAAAPVPVGQLREVEQFSVGGCRGCAVLTDGQVQCWGVAGRAGLGDGRGGDSALPVRVSGLTDVRQVSVSTHACAVRKSGEVDCWGDNTSHQVSPAIAPEPQPTPVRLPFSGVREVQTGTDFSCALLESGEVWCWGESGGGRLGHRGPRHASEPAPETVAAGGGQPASGAHRVPGIGDAVGLDLGHAHACAVLKSGQLRCWGWNGYGQLGVGSRARVSGPHPVSGVSNAQAVSAGARHTCVLHQTGTVSCWGENEWGELGDGSTALRTEPVPVQGLTEVLSVSAGDGRTCAVRKNGSVRCWGRE